MPDNTTPDEIKAAMTAPDASMLKPVGEITTTAVVAPTQPVEANADYDKGETTLPSVHDAIAPGYVAAVQSVLPEGSVISGEPTPYAPVTQGYFSHLFTGLVARVEDILHISPSIEAGVVSYAEGVQARPTVQKFEDDIEQIAADETTNALSFLQKAKAIAAGDDAVAITDAEAAARDIALAAIPASLQGIVSSYAGRILSLAPGIAAPAEQAIAVAIQHGINALSARAAHLFGAE